MTLISGLVGYPISHSRSPALHNQWFQERGIDARYELFECPSLSDAQRFIEDFLGQSQSLGLNITIPYKQFVTQLGVACDASAERVGAANTLYRTRQGLWCLANTDVYGFKKAVEDLGIQARDTMLVLLGSGGAAKAVLMAAEMLGFGLAAVFCRQPQIANSNVEKMELRLPLSFNFFSDLNDVAGKGLGTSVLIVNTLPLGHKGQDNPHAVAALDAFKQASCHFMDLIYEDTPAVLYARTQGIEASNGHKMLVAQAWQSFTLWTGRLN